MPPSISRDGLRIRFPALEALEEDDEELELLELEEELDEEELLELDEELELEEEVLEELELPVCDVRVK